MKAEITIFNHFLINLLILFYHHLDLALLKLDSPFTFSKTIKPIPLNDVESNLEGKNIKLSGWGKTENEKQPGRLREISLKVTENMDIESMKNHRQ